MTIYLLDGRGSCLVVEDEEIDDPIDREHYEGAATEDCHHEDYELDVLTGRATCDCGYRWFLSEAELERHHELAAMPYPGEEES